MEENKYTLHAIVEIDYLAECPFITFTVTWHDEESGLEWGKDSPDGDEYPTSGWIDNYAVKNCGSYKTETEAWEASDSMYEDLFDEYKTCMIENGEFDF